jgi:prefoldin subunit 5
VEQLAHIEESVKALWEKARQAGEVIVRLREEKKQLQSENTSLQQEVTKLRSELSLRDQQAQKLALTATEARNAVGMSNGEREQLAAKVKELLARIDAYL